MRKLFLLFLLFTPKVFGQIFDYRFPEPKDKNNVPVYAGLGLPYLIEPTITNTTYDLTNRTAISLSGDDNGRQYRHLWIYNPSATISIYVCVGNAGGCSSDMWKAPAGLGVVDDYAYFGIYNSITHVYYRLSSTGSVVPVIRWW